MLLWALAAHASKRTSSILSTSGAALPPSVDITSLASSQDADRVDWTPSGAPESMGKLDYYTSPMPSALAGALLPDKV